MERVVVEEVVVEENVEIARQAELLEARNVQDYL